MSLKVLICFSRFHLKFVKLCPSFYSRREKELSDFKLLPLIQINGGDVNGETWYQSGHSVSQIIFPNISLSFYLNQAFAKHLIWYHNLLLKSLVFTICNLLPIHAEATFYDDHYLAKMLSISCT